jgi:hypothetical protein
MARTCWKSAVLVGVPAYEDPELTDIPEVAANATDFAGVLTDARLGAFDSAHCVVAPWRASVAEVGDLLIEAATDAEDLLLFYYSGHGGLVRNHQAPPDSAPADLDDVEVVILLQGNNVLGEPIYSYLKLLGASLRAMFRAMAAGQNFKPTDYGEILESGRGLPSAEVRERMKLQYNMIDVPI